MFDGSEALREKCGLRVFGNEILRRIFEPAMDKNGKRRRIQNELLHDLGVDRRSMLK